MEVSCSLLRNGITSTSVTLDILKVDLLRRWLVSSLRASGSEWSRYHFIAYGNLQDISGTDSLEEITGGVTGTLFKIINKREETGSHLEFDLEPYVR